MILNCLVFWVLFSFGAFPRPHRSSVSVQATEFAETNDSSTVVEKWQAIRSNLTIDLDLFTSGFARMFDTLQPKANLSAECRDSLRTVFREAKLKRTWAVKALDSWGKFPPSGLLSGTFTSFGSFDQCSSVRTEGAPLDTSYCTVLFSPLLPLRPKYHKIVDGLEILEKFALNDQNAVDYMVKRSQFFYYTPMRIGVCLPSSCSLTEVDAMARIVGETMHLKGAVKRCESMSSREFTFDYYVALTVLTSITLMVALVTVLDLLGVFNCRSKSMKISVLRAFSLQSSICSLYSYEKSHRRLQCLKGVRFITMCWIIAGHSAASSNYQAYTDSFKGLQILTSFFAHGLLNASLTVETFYLISGLLTSYLTITSISTTQSFSPFWFVAARYLRLTPAMACAICLVFFLPYLGRGPIWNETIEPIVAGCRKNWWVNLIYMQPYINPHEMCIIPTWWLANDMLFHIMSLPVIMLFLRGSKAGPLATMAIILAFAVTTAIYSFTHNYPIGSIPTRPHYGEYLSVYAADYFWKPYLHGPPFFIGLYLGLLLAEKKLLRICKWQTLFGWALSLLTCFLVIYIPYPVSLGYQWPRVWLSAFDSTNRIAWSLAIAWMIYAMASGHGGWINGLLSSQIFAPLAKATFSIYLTHMFVIWFFVGSQTALLQTTSISLISALVSIWCFSILSGLIWTLFFEAPFLNMMKLVFKHHQINSGTKNVANDWEKGKFQRLTSDTDSKCPNTRL